MRIRTDYPSQSLRVWVGRNIEETQDPVLDVWLCYTPLDAEQRTNRTFGYLSVKKPPIPGLIHLVWPFFTWFTESIFREDKDIVEHEQRAYDAQGADWNNEVFPAICATCGRCSPAAACRYAAAAEATNTAFVPPKANELDITVRAPAPRRALIGNVVEVAIRGGYGEVHGGQQHVRPQREQCKCELESAAGTEQMAVNCLGGAHWDAIGALAEYLLDRRRLDRVVGLRAGTVGVDAVDGHPRAMPPERSAARMAAAWPATVGRVM